MTRYPIFDLMIYRRFRFQICILELFGRSHILGHTPDGKSLCVAFILQKHSASNSYGVSQLLTQSSAGSWKSVADQGRNVPAKDNVIFGEQGCDRVIELFCGCFPNRHGYEMQPIQRRANSPGGVVPFREKGLLCFWI